MYKKNIQNDIIGIYDINGLEIIKYSYDSWGNHKIQVLSNDNYVDISEVSSDNDYIKIAEVNPFRYRSYYYDSETNLYYLNSRYYDSELGRFINADDISMLDITKIEINGLNLYTYCLNNPVNEIDENGYILSFFIGLLIAGLIGAMIGAISYGSSVVVKGVTTGEWKWNWANFLGDTLGGFIGGTFSILPFGGTYIAAFATGVLSTIFTDAFDSLINKSDFNFIDTLKLGAINGLGSIAFVGIIKSNYAFKKVTYGRGSWNAISNQIYTKFRRNVIRHISLKTFGKMFGLSLYESFIGIFKKVLT